MSRNISPFGVRMPSELKEAIQAKASTSGRSLNAEVVHRLEESIESDITPSGEMITAKQARQLSDKALDKGYATLLIECIKEITSQANLGHSDAFIEPNYDWEDDDDVDSRIIQPVKAKLEDLGYVVEESDNGYRVVF